MLTLRHTKVFVKEDVQINVNHPFADVYGPNNQSIIQRVNQQKSGCCFNIFVSRNIKRAAGCRVTNTSSFLLLYILHCGDTLKTAVHLFKLVMTVWSFLRFYV